MRDHEMAESTLAGGSAPSSASSSALTDGCSAGLFLPYHAHQAISSSAGRVVRRVPAANRKAVMSQAISGGVKDAPRTQAHALQALHQRPFVGRKPGLKDSGGNRKCRPLCGAGQQLRSEQHPEQRASLQPPAEQAASPGRT